MERCVARVEVLQDHPLIGGLIAEDDRGIYRQVLHGNYRIIYRIDANVVYIVAVHHAARLLDPSGLK